MAQVPGEQRPGGGAGPAVPLANIKPRLRMAALYFLANSLGYVVAGTENRSDRMVGSFTKYGDGGVDLLPIAGLMKNEVADLARDLDLPSSIVEKPPGARLWSGQTHEEEMGFTYADLERYLTKGPDGVAPALALRIERLVRSTEHKRTPIPQPDDGS
jgi:NAD+ synthase